MFVRLVGIPTGLGRAKVPEMSAYLAADFRRAGAARGRRSVILRVDQRTYVDGENRATQLERVKNPPGMCPAGFESSERQAGVPCVDQYAPAGLVRAAAAFFALCL